jgi:UDP-N-acetylmuramoyl-tripeptide--D-alanyl-D-alanine ligase
MGMITNIGKAHIGEFGGYENIIKGKTELYDHLRMMEGMAFVNGESPILLEKSMDIDRVIYGDHTESEVVTEPLPSDTYLKFKLEGKPVETNLIGAYNLSNMNAAICIGRCFQVEDESIIEALESYDPDNNRSQLIEKNGNRIILDAYNANPTSMKAALDNLSQMKAKRKFAILGHMLELGADSEAEHQHLIELTRIKGIDSIFIGSEFKKLEDLPEGTLIFESVLEAENHLRALDIDDTLILIKGSRGIKLEDTLQFF